MPFKSVAQRKFLFAKKPAMAMKWEKETPDMMDDTKKKKKKKGKVKDYMDMGK
jgi:hypothetical protein